MSILKNKGVMIFILLIALTLILTIVGAIIFSSNNDAKLFVGTWNGVGETNAEITFNSDGTFFEKDKVNLAGAGFDTSFKGTYKLDTKEKVVKMYPEDNISGASGNDSVWVYDYVISDNFLTLENAGSVFEGRKSFSRK